MLLAVRISSYGCTWEVWRALKKLELLSAASRATQLTHLSCSPNFPRASITRYTHAKYKHEQILKYKTINPNLPPARRRHFSCPNSGSRAERRTSSRPTPHHSWTRERVWAFQRPSSLRPARVVQEAARLVVERSIGNLTANVSSMWIQIKVKLIKLN